MIRTTWSVPVESVRYSATLDGAQRLVELAAEQAVLDPSAIAELGPEGWIALVPYRLPGARDRMHFAHVRLAWAPAENQVGVRA